MLRAYSLEATSLHTPLHFQEHGITLYNADGSIQLAQNDDAFPRVSTDSELFFHSPIATSYCVHLQEYNDWIGGMANGGPTFTYSLNMVKLNFAALPLLNKDSDPQPLNNNLASAQPLTESTQATGSSMFIAGMLNPGSNMDFYAFTTGSTIQSSNLYFHPSGKQITSDTQNPQEVEPNNTASTTTAATPVGQRRHHLALPRRQHHRWRHRLLVV